jgi:hypothetical protein
MGDKHKTYQKIFYIACWIILAAILVVAIVKGIGG